MMLINPDGSDLTRLAQGAPGWTRSMGAWSPTGSHLLLRHRDHHLNDSYILRMTASGSGKTRITDKSMGAGFESPKPLGWRQ